MLLPTGCSTGASAATPRQQGTGPLPFKLGIVRKKSSRCARCRKEKEPERDPSLLVYLPHQKHARHTTPLPPCYRPCDLEVVEHYSQVRGTKLRRSALVAFYQLQEAAHRTGVTDILLVSGYRDYRKQVRLYRKSVHATGREHTLQVLAQPGLSEHQLGTALDISTAGSREAEPGGLAAPRLYAWKKDASYRWLRGNAHRFGFVLSYPSKMNRGYAYEPWHFRYVGRKIAARIRRRHIPPQVFLARYRPRLRAFLQCSASSSALVVSDSR